MRNITDRQIRTALRMIYAGTDRAKIAAAVNLRTDIIDQIAVGDITPINAQIPRRKIPPRRCPGCGATINRWPCILCEPDVPVPGDVLVEVEGSDGLTSSQEERKAEVQAWREQYGDPSNPQHPLYRAAGSGGRYAQGGEEGSRSAGRAGGHYSPDDSWGRRSPRRGSEEPTGRTAAREQPREQCPPVQPASEEEQRDERLPENSQGNVGRRASRRKRKTEE